MSELEIVWTKVDEAPALATYSLLPIVESFVGVAGVKMSLKDISLTGRILANFPENLTPEQRVNDELAELGKLDLKPENGFRIFTVFGYGYRLETTDRG